MVLPFPPKNRQHTHLGTSRSSAWNGKTYVTLMVTFTLCTTYFCVQIQPNENRATVLPHAVGLTTLAAATPWVGLSTDTMEGTFATVNPTGTFTYAETKECGLHVAKNPCTIYFPMLEMNDHIPHDEMLESDGYGTDDQTTETTDPQKGKEVTTMTRIVKDLNIPFTMDANNQAVLTRSGFKVDSLGGSKMNQDRLLVLSPFWLKNQPTPTVMIGLFDGHGPAGHEVSHYAALQLPKVFTEQFEKRTIHSDDDVKAALTDTILQIDDDMLAGGTSGSTAIVMLKVGHKLYVANTGDSLAFVAAYNPSSRTVDILYQTSPHKPDLPEERKRIESAGGTITIPPPGTHQSSRVLIPRGDGLALALAMSRSIGDKGGAQVGVIANPTIHVLDLDQLSRSGTLKVFAVAATDGLFDFIQPPDVAEKLARAMHEENASLLDACEQLISRASSLWKRIDLRYRDDISIAVTKL